MGSSGGGNNILTNGKLGWQDVFGPIGSAIGAGVDALQPQDSGDPAIKNAVNQDQTNIKNNEVNQINAAAAPTANNKNPAIDNQTRQDLLNQLQSGGANSYDSINATLTSAAAGTNATITDRLRQQSQLDLLRARPGRRSLIMGG